MKIERHHFQKIDSTNTWAKTHASKFHKNIVTIITADEQNLGRGRFKRVWHSPPGVNVYATFCFFVDVHRMDIGQIPQLLALSLATQLEMLHFYPKLKWPNDVMLSKKKVAGILCETVIDQNLRCVICGIGLNVNMPLEEIVNIDRPATSLSVEAQKEFSVGEVFAELQAIFLTNLEKFLKNGFEEFFEDYVKRSYFEKQDPISFHDNRQVIKGRFDKLNKDGSVTLILEGDDSLQTYYAGEFL